MGLAEEIIGEDPFYPEKLYDKIFNLTDTKNQMKINGLEKQ